LVELLVKQESIPVEYRDHELSGKWRGIRDVHVEADWLLLYRTTARDLVLIRTGTHADLF